MWCLCRVLQCYINQCVVVCALMLDAAPHSPSPIHTRALLSINQIPQPVSQGESQLLLVCWVSAMQQTLHHCIGFPPSPTGTTSPASSPNSHKHGQGNKPTMLQQKPKETNRNWRHGQISRRGQAGKTR